MQYLVKILLTAVAVVVISETAKRSTLAGAVLASIPIISVLALFWLYIDTQDVARVSALASQVFWLVLPSLVFFLVLPLLLKHGIGFYPSILTSMGVTAGCYIGVLWILRRFGVAF